MASFSYQQQQRAISPHRTVVWTEPKSKSSAGRRKAVPVVYYLCREDGQLEHPHFMELTISDDKDGLRLRDFTERLDMVRGKGMSAMYAWSSKRSYRSQGFVWHDLTEDDIIQPAHANEYVLKGSHRFSSSIGLGRRRNKWSSFDFADYKHQHHVSLLRDATVSELGTDQISPPPPSSSSADDTPQEEMRASSVLMQLISCGSIVTAKKNKSHKNTPSSTAIRSDDHDAGGAPEEYFSGSLLIETNCKKKKMTAALKRSSSCNADSRSNKEEDTTTTRSGA